MRILNWKKNWKKASVMIYGMEVFFWQSEDFFHFSVWKAEEFICNIWGNFIHSGFSADHKKGIWNLTRFICFLYRIATRMKSLKWEEAFKLIDILNGFVVKNLNCSD